VGALLDLMLVAAALWFLWKLLTIMGKFKKEPEPPGQSRVPARLRHGPRDRNGAVAIAEPEDDDLDATSANNARLI
jgi:hypothetical protein